MTMTLHSKRDLIVDTIVFSLAVQVRTRTGSIETTQNLTGMVNLLNVQSNIFS